MNNTRTCFSVNITNDNVVEGTELFYAEFNETDNNEIMITGMTRVTIYIADNDSEFHSVYKLSCCQQFTYLPFFQEFSLHLRAPITHSLKTLLSMRQLPPCKFNCDCIERMMTLHYFLCQMSARAYQSIFHCVL